MALPQSFLDQVRERTLLSALIQRSLKLVRAGREWKACCPFHDEKTPSFTVVDAKHFYHCHGCGAHGDAIRWLTDQRGMDFLDAVRELANAAGLEMPERDAAATVRAAEAADLYDLLARAATWYNERLFEAGAAVEYLAARGISERTCYDWKIGWAPGGRFSVRQALPGVPNAVLQNAGLLTRPDDESRPRDFFWERITIPVRDARERLIGFTARALEGGSPKYLNSPDGPVFDKGRVLLNLDRAAPAARRARRLLVVEGSIDPITLAGAGIEEVVAPMGTALTEHQIERAWRVANCPVLLFDGDAAGQRAARRACERAMPFVKPGQSLAIALMPAGEDPDSLVRKGGREAIDAVVADAMPLDQFLFDAIVAEAA